MKELPEKEIRSLFLSSDCVTELPNRKRNQKFIFISYGVTELPVKEIRSLFLSPDSVTEVPNKKKSDIYFYLLVV